MDLSASMVVAACAWALGEKNVEALAPSVSSVMLGVWLPVVLRGSQPDLEER